MMGQEIRDTDGFDSASFIKHLKIERSMKLKPAILCQNFLI